MFLSSRYLSIYVYECNKLLCWQYFSKYWTYSFDISYVYTLLVELFKCTKYCDLNIRPTYAYKVEHWWRSECVLGICVSRTHHLFNPLIRLVPVWEPHRYNVLTSSCLIKSSIQFDTVKFRWYIICFAGSRVKPSKFIVQNLKTVRCHILSGFALLINLRVYRYTV